MGPSVQSYAGFALAAVGSILLAAGCQPSSPEPVAEPEPATAVASQTAAKPSSQPEFVGSKTCRDCHAEFYKLWSTSHHGLAMQPYTAEFARANLAPQADDIVIGKRPVSRGNRRGRRLRPPDWSRRREEVPDRPRDGRQERLLLPDAPGARPAAGAAGGLRRPQEGLVRHGGQRRASLSRPPRRGPALDRPHVHVQHDLLQLPREPACARTTTWPATPTTPRGPSRASVASRATGRPASTSA